MGINLASYVGATQVRRMVLGDDNKQPTPEQLEQMKALVREAMKDGTVGVSTALEYAPAPYAKTEELIALAAEGGKFGGIYSTHMRNESNSVLEAIDEALRIGREAHVPWKSGTSKSRERITGDACPKSSPKSTPRAPPAPTSPPTPTLTPPGSTISRPSFRRGPTMAVTAKLVERLKDPTTRERIRKDMLTPSKTGTTNGRKSRTRGHHDRRRAESQDASAARQAPIRDRKLWNKDPIDASSIS
jgi:N-acyl-D-amino-acid deacylase